MQYTAHATASGKGRDGQVTSDDDDGIQLRLAKPKSLGGKGDGQNPEQLFAMGYAGEGPFLHMPIHLQRSYRMNGRQPAF